MKPQTGMPMQSDTGQRLPLLWQAQRQAMCCRHTIFGLPCDSSTCRLHAVTTPQHASSCASMMIGVRQSCAHLPLQRHGEERRRARAHQQLLCVCWVQRQAQHSALSPCRTQAMHLVPVTFCPIVTYCIMIACNRRQIQFLRDIHNADYCRVCCAWAALSTSLIRAACMAGQAISRPESLAAESHLW